ncbi:hypothetical protein R69927_03147 [Paraburkholderia domus]|jgi:Predicted Fe-S protein|uniref:DUF1289 domain-containing protein n=1 Tax=Paraburkholderia domus TaxID=2793075 RepID=A0A9N8MNF1_9BURK|nr:DUF1289 domain-containing protein [Paraburkholderia domus]MBK5047313.1 DUF1289 domain-containing protein [Burkholderia sp. R-70006]MBK5059172.1 DUF1289 domain-containing protein [Burkholderia sp. R-70199]MBK5086186.1 DUF1289 domain-containing protein [Burkholderia sp. R-69927]MBK5119266.1 DUF1289 domain-containing protein [Burkholderia sp. R-69980]MBK5163254.1 DUF1289 domain-containing protein [Burkholderia sp. R-70211]MBK5179050.1 DUF1289 domain-containing protein [Burkholderia sp. R-6974
MNPGEPAGNPCINICRMDHNDKFCQGCWRTLPEISRWDRMSDQQKADVAALLERRRHEKV